MEMFNTTKLMSHYMDNPVTEQLTLQGNVNNPEHPAAETPHDRCCDHSATIRFRLISRDPSG